MTSTRSPRRCRIGAQAQTGIQNGNYSIYAYADAVNDSGWRELTSIRKAALRCVASFDSCTHHASRRTSANTLSGSGAVHDLGPRNRRIRRESFLVCAHCTLIRRFRSGLRRLSRCLWRPRGCGSLRRGKILHHGVSHLIPRH